MRSMTSRQARFGLLDSSGSPRTRVCRNSRIELFCGSWPSAGDQNANDRHFFETCCSPPVLGEISHCPNGPVERTQQHWHINGPVVQLSTACYSLKHDNHGSAAGSRSLRRQSTISQVAVSAVIKHLSGQRHWISKPGLCRGSTFKKRKQ